MIHKKAAAAAAERCIKIFGPGTHQTRSKIFNQLSNAPQVIQSVARCTAHSWLHESRFSSIRFLRPSKQRSLLIVKILILMHGGVGSVCREPCQMRHLSGTGSESVLSESKQRGIQKKITEIITPRENPDSELKQWKMSGQVRENSVDASAENISFQFEHFYRERGRESTKKQADSPRERERAMPVKDSECRENDEDAVQATELHNRTVAHANPFPFLSLKHPECFDGFAEGRF